MLPSSYRVTRVRFAGAALCALLVLGLAGSAKSADADKRLDRIKGVVGFATDANAPLHEIVGREVLPDDYYAVTRDRSAAALVLGDSSIVAFGQNTRVRVGAFSQTANGPGSTILVENGSLRFDIRRPAGGTANYHFVTPTTQVAVRGTVGLLSFIGGNTTVACLVCAADSVTVTVGTQSLALLTGQFLAVNAAGAVVTGALSSTVVSSFSSAQVSTVAASGSSAATSGIAGAASGAASAAGSAAGTTIGAAAAAAVTTVTVTAIAGKSTPIPATPGTATVSDKNRAPATLPQPTPAPPAIQPPHALQHR
jgi:hypothetical protein